MSVAVKDPVAALAMPASRPRTVHREFPPRPTVESWPVTGLGRDEVLARLTSPPFVAAKAGTQAKRVVGVELLLDWLGERPGRTWQQRWLSGEADLGGLAWHRARTAWLAERGRHQRWHDDYLAVALRVAISADVVRPSLAWLLSGATGRGALVRILASSRDPEGFARLGAHCDADPDVSPAARTRTLYLSALIIAAKGGAVAEITVGDVVELLETRVLASARGISGGSTLFYRMLRESGVLGDQAPPTLGHLRTSRQRTPEEIIDRYAIVCRPVRDLLVDYLKERQPALDYNSLETLANSLGNRFWADLEAHHPGIDSLHLTPAVADAWKQRLATMPKKIKTATGETTEITVPRLSYRECLTPVRALYLDLAHWAVEDPGRWARWVAPCPIGDSEIDLRKGTRQRKSRMDTRTRARLPVLPSLVSAVDQRRKQTAAVLEAAHRAQPGETFTVAGSTFTRQARATGVWAKRHSAAVARLDWVGYGCGSGSFDSMLCSVSHSMAISKPPSPRHLSKPSCRPVPTAPSSRQRDGITTTLLRQSPRTTTRRHRSRTPTPQSRRNDETGRRWDASRQGWIAPRAPARGWR